MNEREAVLTVTDLHPDGNGVGRTQDGMAVFLPRCVPGDRVRAKFIKQTKTYAVGRAEEWLERSSLRQESDCPYDRRCGGCTLRHMSFAAECAWKRSLVENAFRRIGHLSVAVAETVAVNEQRYRNKVAYPLQSVDGRVAFGYYAQRSHELVTHTDCKQQDELFVRIAMFHVKQLQAHRVPVWDERSARGVARHLVMRKNRDGQYLVCMVASQPFAQAKALATELHEAFPQIVGVSLNLNAAAGNTILGRETVGLWGSEVLTDRLCGREFVLSPGAFYQVNPDCAEAIYRKAAELACLPAGGTLLDLYCGAGTIGLCLTDETQRLLGVECVPEAVENAKENAKRNGRTANVRFVCGDASEGVRACRETFGEPDVIVVDPPRKGLSDEVIQTILSVSPKRLLYISCDPATLAKNCADLCAGGYTVKTAIPYQMFPRTGHIETLCLLEQGGGYMGLCPIPRKRAQPF